MGASDGARLIAAVTPTISFRVSAPKRQVFSDLHYYRALLDSRDDLQLVLAEAVFDKQGNVLFEPGGAFDEKVFAALEAGNTHDTRVGLVGEGEIKRWQIRRQYVRLLKEYSDVHRIHQASDFESKLSLLISRLKIQSSIGQHLAVMRAQTPTMFDKTLLGAWLAGLLATEAGYPREVQHAAFESALYRDLGMLYAHPDIIADGGAKIDVKERSELKQHVLVSFDVIMGEISEYPELIEAGVMGHHERLDGSGYPGMLAAEGIEPVARLVAFSDVVCAIRLNRAKDLLLDDVVKMMLLEQDCYDTGVFTAFQRLVTANAAPDDESRRARRVDALVERAKLISTKVDFIKDEIGRPGRDSNFFPPGFVDKARATIKSVLRSGHNDDELGWWLKVVAAGREEADPQLLQEVDLQQLEVLRQLERLEDEIGQGPLLTQADLHKPKIIG